MSELSKVVMAVGERYLGFAAKRYFHRQCDIHLEKDFDNLELDDLEEFITWINNTAPLVMDQESSKELVEALRILQHEEELDAATVQRHARR